MHAQLAGLAVILGRMVGNVDMDFVGQSLNFPVESRRIDVDECQVDVRCSSQQVFVFQQRTAQVNRLDAAIRSRSLGSGIPGDFEQSFPINAHLRLPPSITCFQIKIQLCLKWG
jgi:hypothetical protein